MRLHLVFAAFLSFLLLAVNVDFAADSQPVRLITLDPGHFHAALVQKFMYPQVDSKVAVYAPPGQDVQEHLLRIEGYNTRSNNPTRWQEQVYTNIDFLDRMVKDKTGSVVVIAGNNLRKTEYISRSIDAGFNVLADKPMAINPTGFYDLQRTFQRAVARKVLLYDIMTERFEITSILQRELARVPSVFGSLKPGTDDVPGVEMESVHNFFKEVSGKPLIRPAWFFDLRQQGEAIPDVGTHLVDLVQWECFPDQVLNWRSDVKVQKARRWATVLTPAQFKLVTGLDQYPDFLKRDVGPGNLLTVYANGDVNYVLRGVHVKVTASWKFQGEPGAGDTHYSILRGTRANLVIRQGAEQKFVPTLYVENTSSMPPAEFEPLVRSTLGKLSDKWPGLAVKAAQDGLLEITIPEKYRVGHEAHFAQVTENYLRYLADGKLPEWEVPNMLAKYYVTTEAYQLSHETR
jgi:predicted dehydrogenase